MADDWFRSPDWSPLAQDDFDKRLARARAHNRAQYLRIKGLALSEAGELRGARALWERVLRLPGDPADLQKASALEHLGDSWVRDDPAMAEGYYRRLLADHPTLNGTSHSVEISLAELLVRRGDRASAEEAAAHLSSFLQRSPSPFPSVLFRWHLALIDVARATRETETVQRAARTALDLAARGPVFSRHPTVGVVDADAGTLRRLRKLAR